MRSHKRRNTSPSGKSPSSKKAKSRQPTGTSSPNAPASFEQVFGRNTHPDVPKLHAQLASYGERLAAHRQLPVPTHRLLRSRHLARLRRLEVMVDDLTTLIATLSRVAD